MAHPEPEAESDAQPPTEPTSEAVKNSPALSAFARWARPHWGVLVAVGAPLITVATIVIPLAAEAGVRLSSAETLRIEAVDEAPPLSAEAPAADGEPAWAAADADGFRSAETVSSFQGGGAGFDRNWRVRSDAPWEQFPVGDPEHRWGCSAAQVEFLEEWGRRTIDEIWHGQLTLSNTATDGASMSLSNLRSVGEFIVPVVPEVEVTCGGGTGGGEDIIVVRHELNSSLPAVFGAKHDNMPEGTPAVINIAPGQFVQLLASFTRPPALEHADFRGDFVADLSVGGTTTTVTLFQGFTRIAPAEIQTVDLTVDGEWMYCGVTPCSIEEFAEHLRADPGYTR